MTTMASQITSLTVVYSTVYSDTDQRKHQISASLAFVWGIHRDRWIPRTKGQLRGKCFHLMTSSWGPAADILEAWSSNIPYICDICDIGIHICKNIFLKKTWWIFHKSAQFDYQYRVLNVCIKIISTITYSTSIVGLYLDRIQRTLHTKVAFRNVYLYSVLWKNTSKSP